MKEENNNKNYEEKQLVIFSLANEEFGVNITEVKEIIKPTDITSIPNTDNYMKGVINLRGKIIVIIDLAKKLGLPSKEFDKNTRIIVTEIENSTIGMIVDKAQEVLRINTEMIKDAPDIIKQKIDSDYLTGVGIVRERLIILLDLTKVLDENEIKKIEQTQKQ